MCIPDDVYPHGSPEFNCDLTAAMKPCRDTKTAIGVFTADCATVAARKKRSASYKEKAARQKRSTSDYEPPSYPMVSDDEPSVITTEEWKNDWTEALAEQHCRYHFEKAPAFNVCSEYVPYVDKTPFINGCIKDIKSTGGDSWLKVTIRNFASVCLQESKRLEILTVTNSTNSTGSDKPIASIIEESTCPDDCSNNGLCIDEECQCNNGYFGEACSITTSQSPTVIRNAFEDLCDSSKKPCQTFIVPGYDFIDGAGLTCKYTSMSPTCPVEAEKPLDDESKTKIWIIVPVVAAVVMVLIIIAVLIFKLKLKPKQSYIRDSTLSLPNTTRQSAPKSHFLTSEHIFLSEKFRSESATDFNESKCGWK
ncbi:TN [Mytilus edulis]|uniref:TN n=1 Tax=Mytilus edulis TaxID=6550 RepID=A0A8S3S8C5_MYTED|nr:TN [Mytilus edulis]